MNTSIKDIFDVLDMLAEGMHTISVTSDTRCPADCEFPITETVTEEIEADYNVVIPEIDKIRIEESKERMTVYFKDGTWVTVKRSADDQNVPLVGLLYALIKRAYGKIEKSGFVRGDGFMNFLKGYLDKAETEAGKAKEKAARIKANQEAQKKAHAERVAREAAVNKKEDEAIARIASVFGKALAQALTANQTAPVKEVKPKAAKKVTKKSSK